jgi:PAS domain S-box-containing protein
MNNIPHTAASKNVNSNHFEAFFEFATMGILVTDCNGEITAANPFALKEFGYADEELIGQKIETLIPSRFYSNHLNHREKYLKDPRIRRMGNAMELYALRKDGTEFPVEISLGNYNSNGDRYVIAFISNISIRRKAEKKIEKLTLGLESTVEKRTRDLKETLQQLETSRDELEDVLSFQKALLDNAGAMIIATDEKGIIKLFNPEASHNIGYEEAEVVNKFTTVLFHNKKDIARKRNDLFNEFGLTIADDFAVLVEKSRRNSYDEEQYIYYRKNGSHFPVSLTITSIKNSEGQITGFMGIAIDISERKKAEEDLRQSLEKEKELNELKSRFVSMASHEFRTPLSTVLSSAYLIEKYTIAQDQHKRQKHLRRIVSSVNMLTDILNDLLSVGKIEEGKIQVRLTQFDIQELITSVAGEIKNTLKHQQKIYYIHEGDRQVFMDVSLVKHIIMNLVSNASKFSPEDCNIEIKTIGCPRYLTLTVKDHGIGISKDDQKHLMERFFRGANVSHIQGTGLGLHIVSKYAELMLGSVECVSELEKGTEFIIKFKKKSY